MKRRNITRAFGGPPERFPGAAVDPGPRVKMMMDAKACLAYRYRSWPRSCMGIQSLFAAVDTCIHSTRMLAAAAACIVIVVAGRHDGGGEDGGGRDASCCYCCSDRLKGTQSVGMAADDDDIEDCS